MNSDGKGSTSPYRDFHASCNWYLLCSKIEMGLLILDGLVEVKIEDFFLLVVLDDGTWTAVCKDTDSLLCYSSYKNFV